MNKAIFISGTPCTGKTTVSELLADKLKCRLVKINDLAIENDFVLGIDDEKGYKVIDIPSLNEKVSQIISENDGLIIFEGHLSHLCGGAEDVALVLIFKRGCNNGICKARNRHNTARPRVARNPVVNADSRKYRRNDNNYRRCEQLPLLFAHPKNYKQLV